MSGSAAGTERLIAIEVALYASLRRYHPEAGGRGPFWLLLPEGTTVRGLMDVLGIPASMIKQAFVDHVQKEGDYLLKDRSSVAIFSPIAGGR